jgi:hypothetical protein
LEKIIIQFINKLTKIIANATKYMLVFGSKTEEKMFLVKRPYLPFNKYPNHHRFAFENFVLLQPHKIMHEEEDSYFRINGKYRSTGIGGN